MYQVWCSSGISTINQLKLFASSLVGFTVVLFSISFFVMHNTWSTCGLQISRIHRISFHHFFAITGTSSMLWGINSGYLANSVLLVLNSQVKSFWYDFNTDVSSNLRKSFIFTFCLPIFSLGYTYIFFSFHSPSLDWCIPFCRWWKSCWHLFHLLV